MALERTVFSERLVSATAGAEVSYSETQGFEVQHQVIIQQPVSRVYQALTTEIGQWWSSGHTYSGAAKNLYLEARAGGCFCEIWIGTDGERQQVQHLQVVMARPPAQLRLTGGLGPLQQEAVAGVMDWRLSWDEEQRHTQVDMVYKVSGHRPGGMAGWAAPVDQVLGEQIRGLARHLGESAPASGE